MTDQGQRSPGWKKDPSGRYFGRYWDGAQWTEHVISAEKVQSVDPVPAPPKPAVRSAPAQPAARYERPAPTAPGGSPHSSSTTGSAGDRRQAAYLILGGAGAVAVGCFLPWAAITAPFVGTISKAGMEGGDGVFFLGLAAAAAVVASGLARGVPARIPLRRWTLAVLIIVLGLLTAFEVADVTRQFADISGGDSPIGTSYGAGLWLVGVGVILAAAGWVRMPWRRLADETAATP